MQTKIEKNEKGEEVCSKCKMTCSGAKYLSREDKGWICGKCYFEEK